MCALIAELLYKAEASTGEGAIWHPGRKSLFWVDIEGKTLYEYIPDEERCRSWIFDRMVSAVVPEDNSTVILALQDRIVRVNLENNMTQFLTIIDDLNGAARCNDGKCDPEGRFWIGTITKKMPPGLAKLYTVEKDGKLTTRLSGVTNSNGLVWSADNQWMYYIDTPTRQVVCYRFNPQTGDISFDRIAIEIDPQTGKPDGMTIDENGNLWVCQWGGYGVYCYDPFTGNLIDKVEVPVPYTPSCAFGGENLDTLYITTARGVLSEKEVKCYPESGSLFCCKPGVKGVKANYFGDSVFK